MVKKFLSVLGLLLFPASLMAIGGPPAGRFVVNTSTTNTEEFSVSKGTVTNLYVTGSCVGCGSGGSGSPGGSSGQVQVNVGGSFGAYSNLTYNGSQLTAPTLISTSSAYLSSVYLSSDTSVTNDPYLFNMGSVTGLPPIAGNGNLGIRTATLEGTGRFRWWTGGSLSPAIQIGSDGLLDDLSISTSGVVDMSGLFRADPTSNSVSVRSTGTLRLYDADNSNYVGLKASNTVTSNLTLMLPTAVCSGVDVLTIDSTGAMVCTTPSGGGGSGNYLSSFVLISTSNIKYQVTVNTSGTLITTVTASIPAGILARDTITVQDADFGYWTISVNDDGTLVTTNTGMSAIVISDLLLNDSSNKTWIVTVNTSGNLVTS